MSSTTLFSFPLHLWNCQSAVNKTDFMTSISSHSGVSLLALTQTWIRPEDTVTPAALSTHFTFSHTPRLTGRRGGTGLLISNDWKFSPQPPLLSFESHSITITSLVLHEHHSLLKKHNLNPAHLESYRALSLIPFVAQKN